MHYFFSRFFPKRQKFFIGLVACGGMLRSGSTLQYNIASEIVELKGLGQREVWVDDHQKYFAEMDGKRTRVFKSHRLSEELKQLIEDGHAKAIVSYRDLRDAVASWQAKNRTVLDVQAGMDFAESAVSMLRDWEDLGHDKVMVSQYETMISDIPREIEKTADFLDISLTKREIKKISNSVSVDKIQDRLSSLLSEDITRSGELSWDTKTLVHLNHLNGGGVGRFKNELSKELISEINHKYLPWLIRHGYNLD